MTLRIAEQETAGLLEFKPSNGAGNTLFATEAPIVCMCVCDNICSWGESERAPHGRVEHTQFLYYHYGTSVTHAPLWGLYISAVCDSMSLHDIFLETA